ncbi:MAG: hypothetical protein V1926_03275 [Candidatus Peregrinibacteria bacterium]
MNITPFFKKKFIIPTIVLLFVIVLGIAVMHVRTSSLTGLSTDAQGAAARLALGAERTGSPVALLYGGGVYYYVPLEVNGTVSGTFPGVMVDANGNIVTDATTLRELFRYPGLLKRFAGNMRSFQKVASTKKNAIAKYCTILQRQEARLGGIVASGRAVGVVYEGTKLAYDAVGMVKNAVNGLGVLVKDLAKSTVQDSLLLYFTSTDTRAVVDSAQKAYESAQRATQACDTARGAWESIAANVKLTTDQARGATESLGTMFREESFTITYLKEALTRVTNYPQLVTKISSTDYSVGVQGLDTLIVQLQGEQRYWQGEYEEEATFLDDWVAEQRARSSAPSAAPTMASPAARPVTTTPATAPAPSFSCQSVDIANQSSLYTYTRQDAQCPTVSKNLSSNNLSVRCTTADGQWRAYWVKRVNVPAGASQIRIKADIGLKEYRSFFTECPGRGVKSPNYVSLMVLGTDPSSTLQSECNRVCAPADWGKCAVPLTAPTTLGSCGMPACAESQRCDFQVATSGRNSVFLVFGTADAWPADVEGKLSAVQVCPAQ